MQDVSGNFDCNIFSVKGQKETHLLALIIVQNGKGDIGGDNSKLIPHLKKGSLKSADLKEVQTENYEGPKNPMMTDIEAVKRNSMAEIVSKGEIAAKLEGERYALLPRNHPHTQNT